MHDGDVMDRTTLLHGILCCGAYTSELKDYPQGIHGLASHEVDVLSVAAVKETNEEVRYNIGDVRSDPPDGMKDPPSYAEASPKGYDVVSDDFLAGCRCWDTIYPSDHYDSQRVNRFPELLLLGTHLHHRVCA